MGFEIELDRRVADAKQKAFEGDELLAAFPAGFRIVTDKRVAQGKSAQDWIIYSNVEFVTDPYDQLSRTDSLTPLLTAMREAASALYAPTATTSLAAALGPLNGKFWLTRDTGQSALIYPVPRIPVTASGGRVDYVFQDRGIDSLFPHYTVGIPLGALGPALKWFGERSTQLSNPDFAKLGVQRGDRAATAATHLFAWWARHRGIELTKDDVLAFAGYVALVYTQAAAIIDHAYTEGKEQIKNKVIALSRVPLRAVAYALPVAAQAFLKEQALATLLSDNKVTDLAKFIETRFQDAQKHRLARYAAGNDKLAEVEQLITKYSKTNLGDPENAHLLAGLQSERTTLLNERQHADLAVIELEKLSAFVPSFDTVFRETRSTAGFPWSILDHAFVPALEGRLLKRAGMDTGRPGDLFENNPGADGGPSRDLETGTPCNIDANRGTINPVDLLTLGLFLDSALLVPGVPVIAMERLFGGMKEIPEPDRYQVNHAIYRLVPLELRAYGAGSVSWSQLAHNLREIAAYSSTLMPS